MVSTLGGTILLLGWLLLATLAAALTALVAWLFNQLESNEAESVLAIEVKCLVVILSKWLWLLSTGILALLLCEVDCISTDSDECSCEKDLSEFHFV